MIDLAKYQSMGAALKDALEQFAQAAATRLGVSFPVSFEWIRFDRSGR